METTEEDLVSKITGGRCDKEKLQGRGVFSKTTGVFSNKLQGENVVSKTT